MKTTTNTLLKTIALHVVCPALFVLLCSCTTLSQPLTLHLPLSKPKGSDSNTTGKEDAQKPIGVNLCLFQRQHVEGVTHPKGVQLRESGPLDFVRIKPIFTLTAKHINKCELKETNPPFANNIDYFTLYIEFSELGKAEMFAAFKNVQPIEYVAVVNERAFPVRIAFRAETPDNTIKKMNLGYFVDRDFGQSFADVLNPMAVPTPQERMKQLYFPTVVGTKRVIQSTLGENTINDTTETISKVVEKDGKYIVTLHRENPGSEVGYGERFFKYQYEVSPKGVFTLSTTADGKLEKPEPLLKLPAKVADMWTHEHLDAKQGIIRTGNFTVWGQELVEVPAGRFEAIPIHKQNVWKRNGKQVGKWKSTTWYAIGVGVVKHVSDSDGEKRVSELIEFTRGVVK